MANFSNNRFLQTARIKAIVQTLASELERARPLVYINKLPIVPAFDDEIMGRFVGTVLAADLIADDQEAVVQEAGRLELFTNQIPNIKHGTRLGQQMLNRLDKIERYGIVEEENAFLDWEMRLAENLVLGIRQRMNALACAMFMDALDYDRLGFRISGASWGMPSALKVTPAVPWTTAASATPIDNILSMDQITTDGYGFTFDHITMSRAAFRFMIATTEFANKASIMLGAGFSITSSNINTKNDTEMQELASRMLGKTIELDDATYNERTNAGAKIVRRYLPANKVLLTRKQDHGDSRVWDFANGVVTESIVAGMISNGPDGLGGLEYGPVAYWTARQDLNPPDITCWGVARGFPRKMVPEASAVLTVGTF